LDALIPLVRLSPKWLHHNSMNLNHIGQAHIIPRRDGTTFLIIVLVMCSSSKYRRTRILGASIWFSSWS